MDNFPKIIIGNRNIVEIQKIKENLVSYTDLVTEDLAFNDTIVALLS